MTRGMTENQKPDIIRATFSALKKDAPTIASKVASDLKTGKGEDTGDGKSSTRELLSERMAQYKSRCKEDPCLQQFEELLVEVRKDFRPASKALRCKKLR